MITVDMTKAVDIQRDRIRAARAPMLAALDVEFMRAVERGNKAERTRIATEKQRLRDATKDPRLMTAQSPEELAAILP